MTAHVNVSGTWQVAGQVYVKVAGVWKGPVQGYVKVGSTWKLFTFEPITHTYTGASPGSYSETVPNGASSLRVICAGAGSGGAVADPGPGIGGGSGGIATKTVAISSSHWGSSIGYAVSVGGDGAFGPGFGEGGSAYDTWASNGTIIGSDVYGRAGAATGGGGVASGGDTNVNGNSSSGSTGGASVSSNGLTSGKGGNGGSGESGNGQSGGDGTIRFEWS